MYYSYLNHNNGLHGDFVIMMNRTTRLSLFLIPVLMFTGCDQGASVTTDSAERVSFQLNEHQRQFGDYVVHVNALTTDQLPTEVAQGYQIARSKNRAMLNVSVQKQAGASETAIPAKIDVVVKNLTNQIKDISVREIRETEPQAIYYIGEVPVSHEETLVFNIDLTPEGATDPILLSYRQRFFTQ